MWIVQSIKTLLDKDGVRYRLLQFAPFRNLQEAAASDEIPAEALVQAVLLRDQFGLMLAVIPADHEVNLAALRKAFKRDLQPISRDEQKLTLKQLEPGFIPPLGNAFGIKTVIDDAVAALQRVYFAAGDNSHLFEVDAKNFHLLQKNASFAAGISRAAHGQGNDAEAGAVQRLTGDPYILLKQRLARLDKLPTMPELATRIIQLNNNPYAHVDDLAELVGQDPSLAAQIMRYASSPLYGYGSIIDSIGKAIRVLGYDVVMNLALGITTSKSLHIPRGGPLGLRAYWRHATYSAALVQALGKELPRELRPRSGLCYLTGLLHNFGQLALGALFPREFEQLNRLLAEQDERPLVQMELELLGFHHGHLGAWLLESWGLPEEISTACREHHNPRYHGPHATYVRLTHIANSLLSNYNIGPEPPSVEPPLMVMQALQLSEQCTDEVVENIMLEAVYLNEMAQELAA